MSKKLLLPLGEDIDDATSFARGIASAIQGLECLNASAKDGVLRLMDVHATQLEALARREALEASAKRSSHGQK
jgi:hypothetical protein